MLSKLALTLGLVSMISLSWWAAENSARARVKSKQEVLSVSEDAGDRHTEKVTGPLTVRVELGGAAPEKVGDIYKLLAHVQSAKDMKNVKLTWLVPGTAQVVS